MADKRTLIWLEGLRGIAAILVVLCHARDYLHGLPTARITDPLLQAGAMGVDLFFVISGFIMVYTTADKAGPAFAARFMVKRIAKIWPTYVVASTIYLLVAYGGFAYFEQGRNLLFYARSLVFYPANPHILVYFAMPLSPTWTLVFEWYFYLVFAASLLLRRNRLLAQCGWFFATLVLLPLFACHSLHRLFVFGQPDYPVGYLNVVTNPIVWDFVAGILIAHLYRLPLRIHSKPLARALLLATIVLMPLMVWLGVTTTHGPLQWGWPIFLFFLAMAIASKTLDIRYGRLIARLGETSYSIYLTHLIGFALFDAAWSRFVGGIATHIWLHVALAVPFALLLSQIFYHRIESPSTAWMRRKLLRLSGSGRAVSSPPQT